MHNILRKKLFISYLFFLLTFSIGLYAEKHIRPSYIQIRHREHKGMGYDTGYSSVNYFLTSADQEIPVQGYLDFRTHVFNTGRVAGNVGAGIRHFLEQRDLTYGFNCFFDYRKVKNLFPLQAGFRMEFFTENYDIRSNIYIPFGDKTSRSSNKFVSFEGHHAKVTRDIRAALTHLDLSVSFPFLRNLKEHDLDLSVTGYYLLPRKFDCKSFGNSPGIKAGARYLFDDFVYADFEASFDGIYKARATGAVGISIPFGTKRTYKKRLEYLGPAVRNEIIPTDKKKCEEFAIDPNTSNPYFFVFVNNLTPLGGDGSIEYPHQGLASAESFSKSNDIIYLFSGNGTDSNYDTGFIMKDNQTFQGSGTQLALYDVVIPPQTPGNPTITNTAGSAITLASNTLVNGISISSPSTNGVLGFFVSDVTLSNLSIDSPGTNGISLSLIENYSIKDTSITNSTDDGISLNLASNGEITNTFVNLASSQALSGIGIDDLTIKFSEFSSTSFLTNVSFSEITGDIRIYNNFFASNPLALSNMFILSVLGDARLDIRNNLISDALVSSCVITSLSPTPFDSLCVRIKGNVSNTSLLPIAFSFIKGLPLSSFQVESPSNPPSIIGLPPINNLSTFTDFISPFDIEYVPPGTCFP